MFRFDRINNLRPKFFQILIYYYNIESSSRMANDGIVDLRLHQNRTMYCFNLDVPVDKTLRDVSAFLRTQIISAPNQEFRFWMG